MMERMLTGALWRAACAGVRDADRKQQLHPGSYSVPGLIHFIHISLVGFVWCVLLPACQHACGARVAAAVNCGCSGDLLPPPK
jgi:hypothetical protein